MTSGTPEDRLLELTREAYNAVAGALPERGHCFEVARLGSVLAKALGLNGVALCRGTRPWKGASDQHGWLLLPDGRIMHSPKRGVVEMIEPTGFVELWRVGPPPSRQFKVPPR